MRWVGSSKGAGRASATAWAVVLLVAIATARAASASDDPMRSPFGGEREASRDGARRAARAPRAVAATPAPRDEPEASTPLPMLGMRYEIETGPVTFGDVLPDQDATVDKAIVVRVFSDRDWRLVLSPGEPLRSIERGRAVPVSRLSWRSSFVAAHTPFRDGAAVTIASGPRTSGAGSLVAVDLRLRIADEDPLGSYATSFRLELAPN